MAVCTHFCKPVPAYGTCACANTCHCQRAINGTCLKRPDAVNHPAHYASGKIECIDALEEATKDLKGVEAFCTANAIKYLWRWKKKNGHEDLQKARWYINYMLGETSKQKASSQVVPSSEARARCIKCDKEYFAEQLNNEGWCRECFAAPTVAPESFFPLKPFPGVSRAEELGHAPPQESAVVAKAWRKRVRKHT